jgi:orotidine 5'-phosphate decarboxylase subfamily 2
VAGGYLDRLATRTAEVGSVLCVGLDPDPDDVPAELGQGLDGIERFAQLILEAAIPVAAAIKANLAFFEAHGSNGIAVLERLRSTVPANVPFIADAKRGDVGSTAARQAVALLDGLGADAVTLSPYLGRDAIVPFLERPDSFAYVLCRTSNHGAGELQDLLVPLDADAGAPAEPLWARVARRTVTWDAAGRLGLVVGATAPAELAEARRIAPGLAFLVPGVGAQGGSAEAVLDAGRASAPPAGGRPGGGLLVNVSRGISRAAAHAAGEHAAADPVERLAAAARAWSARLPVLP